MVMAKKAKKTAKKAAATTKKAAPKAKKATAKKATSKAKAKGGGSGFMKAYTLSDALAAVIGKAEAARTEITSGLWKYIKANDLQDPKNKRDILTDAKLKAVFGKPKVGMFEMTKLIGKHLK
jgi:upstream activation factor subunit UAF30